MAEMARNIVTGPLASDEVLLDKTCVIAEKKCRNRTSFRKIVGAW